MRQNKKPPRRKCLNYSYVMGELLPLLWCCDFNVHVNFLNAFFNCFRYDDDGRYIPTDGNYGVYLSDMLNAKRNPPKELRTFLVEGRFLGKTYGIPNVATFKEIISPSWHLSKEEEISYRDCIRDCLYNGDTSHLTKVQKQKIENLLNNESDFQTMIFYLVEIMLKSGNNDFCKKRSKRNKAETIHNAVKAIDSMPIGLLTLHENDLGER